MSLGLGDLNKRKSKTPSMGAGATVAGPVKVKSTFVGSKTARPWSDEGLTKRSQRRAVVDREAVMNEEWLSLYAEPLLNTNFIEETLFSRLAVRLLAIEEMIQNQIQETLGSVRQWVRKG